jgi:hypothetical protein
MDMLNGFFRKQAVPLDLRQQCHTYMDVYRKKIEDSVYNKVLKLFPPQLQQKLAVTMMTSMVRDAQVLKWAHGDEEEIFKKELALIFECAVYPMQESIFKQNDFSDSMYVVCKGLVRSSSESNTCAVSLFAQGHCFGWEMIRNVSFEGNKYMRVNSADSFTVVLLQRLKGELLREALQKKELRKTAKRIKRAAHWCLVRECVVSLGKSLLVLKAAAGLPTMTPTERRIAKEFYHQMAQQENTKKEVNKGTVRMLPIQVDEAEIFANMEETESHVKTLQAFGGQFLDTFKQKHPSTDFDSLRQFVKKSNAGGNNMSDIVAAAMLAKRKKNKESSSRTSMRKSGLTRPRSSGRNSPSTRQ